MPTDSTAILGGHRRFPARAIAALEILVLCALEIRLLANLTSHVDIHIADETLYYHNGLLLWRGDLSGWNLQYAPLYSLVYGLIDRLHLPFLPLDTMQYLICIASTVGLWWAVRPIAPRPVPLLLAAVWGSAPVLMHYGQGWSNPNANYFGMLLFIAATGCALRRRWWTCALCTGLTYFVRIEILSTAAAIGVLGVVASFRPSWRSMRRPGLVFLGITVVLVCVTLCGRHNDKPFIAFAQHYSAGAWIREGRPALASPGDHPFHYPMPRIRRDFGEVDSVMGALAANPTAFARHVWSRVEGLPGALYEVAFASYCWCPWVHWTGLVVVGLLFVAGMVRGRRHIGHVFSRCPPDAWLFIIGASVALLPPALLVGATPRLLISAWLGIWIVIVCIALANWPAARVQRPAVRAVTAVLVPVALLVGMFVVPGPYAPQAPRPGMFRSGVELVRQCLPREGRPKLMAPWAVSYYRLLDRPLGDAVDLFLLDANPATSHLPFAELVARYEPDFVLGSPDLLPYEQSHAGLQATLTSPEWEPKQTLGTFVWLARRSPR